MRRGARHRHPLVSSFSPFLLILYLSFSVRCTDLIFPPFPSLCKPSSASALTQAIDVCQCASAQGALAASPPEY